MTEEEEWEDVQEVNEACELEEPQEHVQPFEEPYDAAAESRREIVFINSSHQACPPGAAIIYATLNSVGARGRGWGHKDEWRRGVKEWMRINV